MSFLVIESRRGRWFNSNNLLHAMASISIALSTVVAHTHGEEADHGKLQLLASPVISAKDQVPIVFKNNLSGMDSPTKTLTNVLVVPADYQSVEHGIQEHPRLLRIHDDCPGCLAFNQRTAGVTTAAGNENTSEEEDLHEDTGGPDAVGDSESNRSPASDLWDGSSRPLAVLGINIATKAGEGKQGQAIPDNEAVELQGLYRSAPNHIAGIPQPWVSSTFQWTAPSFYHRPLYFEQVNLERYGHFHRNWLLQSALSTAHFFGTIPSLPYRIGTDHPHECVYTLGHRRPGNCNPHQRHLQARSPSGLALQAIMTAGSVFAF